jgi:hypothetical protein
MRKTILIFLFCNLIIVFAGAQWQSIISPPGGFIRNFISDNNLIYAATASGVLVSENSGASWSFRNNGLKSCDTKSFARAGGYIFVSTDENVFRTNNQGLDWEPAGVRHSSFFSGKRRTGRRCPINRKTAPLLQQ